MGPHTKVGSSDISSASSEDSGKPARMCSLARVIASCIHKVWDQRKSQIKYLCIRQAVRLNEGFVHLRQMSKSLRPASLRRITPSDMNNPCRPGSDSQYTISN